MLVAPEVPALQPRLLAQVNLLHHLPDLHRDGDEPLPPPDDGWVQGIKISCLQSPVKAQVGVKRVTRAKKKQDKTRFEILRLCICIHLIFCDLFPLRLYPSYIDLDGGTKCRLYSNVMGECRHQTCSQINENDVKLVKNFLRIQQQTSIKSGISIVNGLRSLTLCDIFLKFMRSKSFRSLGLDDFYQNDSIVIGSANRFTEPSLEQDT